MNRTLLAEAERILYGDVRREIETADPLTSPRRTISQRIARLRAERA